MLFIRHIYVHIFIYGKVQHRPHNQFAQGVEGEGSLRRIPDKPSQDPVLHTEHRRLQVKREIKLKSLS